MTIAREIQRKNRHKRWRTMLQIMICLGFILGLTIRSYSQPIYDESSKAIWKQTQGFSIISYTGVREEADESMISTSQLEKHFAALKEAGYETIGIEEVIQFYEKGIALPDQAILILFEDGQRQTYLNVQPLLEVYNFKATMMTYAYDLISSDRGQLKVSDLSLLEDSSYWDIGSNGYRYSKINVMEEQDSEGEVIEQYHHYLLDYLRDQDGVPTESKEEMIERITWDYDEMKRIYEKSLEDEIALYRIMHSDALFGNMHHAVEQVNLDKIEEVFSLMINREGSCYNSSSTPIYNLTKMSVSQAWDAEELLAQINDWTRLNTTYQATETQWYPKEGDVRLDEAKLILMPNQHQRAFALLKGMAQQDYDVLLYLTEREAGTQTIYLRYDELQQTYIKVSLTGNTLKVTERTADEIEKLLYETSILVEELIAYQEDSLYYKMDASNAVTPISWKIKLQLKGNQLTVVIGGKGESIEIDSSISTGHLALETISELEAIFDELKIEMR